jgi:hypothetical protein
MTTSSPDPFSVRRYAYAILIIIAGSSITGRLMNTVYFIEPWARRWPTERPATYPTLSSNDRSRWATIRALVDEHTYVVGYRTITDPETGDYEDTGIRRDDGFRGVDYVLHPDGKRFFSSKPPLFPTLLAGGYWILQQITGWTLAEQLTEVVRTMLVFVNVLPMMLYLAVLAQLVERYGGTDWGRLFVMATAALGTLLTTFGVTLNNHLPAAFATLFTIYFALRICNDGQRRWWLFAITGLLNAFVCVCEIPGVALALGVFLLLLAAAPKPTLTGFLPALVLVGAAYILTNYLAIGRFTPAYRFSRIKDREHSDYTWYHFKGSPWAPENIAGIDAADEPKHLYALHALVGHHGIFSTSPVFLLSLLGMWLAWRKSAGLRSLALLTAALTVVVIAFYILFSNNYGGNTAGFRWTFWLIPLWLLVMLPAADRMSCCRWGRSICLVLLAVSVMSVTFPTWNPWRPNWPYRLMEYWEMIEY